MAGLQRITSLDVHARSDANDSILCRRTKKRGVENMRVSTSRIDEEAELGSP